MTDIVALEALKKFLTDKVIPQIKLKKPNDKKVTEYKLIHPAVHIGWIPPNGYLPPEIESAIPCIIVGYDEGEDDNIETNLNIRLSFAIWNPGFQDEEQNLTPDFEGYRDLSNFIEKTKHELKINKIIEGTTTIQYPIKWGLYQDQPYPYWYGYITFKVNGQSEEYIPDAYSQYLK